MGVGFMFLLMFGFFLLTVPVAIALGLASAAALLSLHMPVALIAQQFFTGLNSFSLLAIPFFILSGSLMESTGISRKLINFVGSFVGHSYGGYAVILIVTCLFFGALSGSAAATVAAIGGIMVPHMVKKGYDAPFATATAAASAGLAVIIPPSIQMILYCVAVNTSITKLFTAGFIPGIILGITEIIYAKHVSKKRGFRGEEKKTGAERWQAFKDAIWALLMPVIILGGIYGGIFTATEASAIAVGYALIVGFFIYRTLTLKKLYQSLLDSCITVTVVMLVLSTAQLFAYVLTYQNVPSTVANFLISIAPNKYVFLVLINIFLLIVGMFFDPGPGMIILAPILAPAAMKLGIDPTHFGLIMVINFSIGAITPPFAVNLFVASQIGDMKYEQIVKPILPYIGLLIIDLMIITYIPALSMFLPNLLGR